jgi:hypothetical protein
VSAFVRVVGHDSLAVLTGLGPCRVASHAWGVEASKHMRERDGDSVMAVLLSCRDEMKKVKEKRKTYLDVREKGEGNALMCL